MSHFNGYSKITVNRMHHETEKTCNLENCVVLNSLNSLYIILLAQCLTAPQHSHPSFILCLVSCALQAYPTLTRVFGPFSKMGSFFVEICKEFGWKRIGIIHDNDTFWTFAAEGIR